MTKKSTICTATKSVLVRAYGGRAERMECRAASSGRVEVARVGCVESISLPEELVFLFSKSTERLINRAVDAGDHGQVGSLWSAAKRFEPQPAS
jgi:hypothetical protein